MENLNYDPTATIVVSDKVSYVPTDIDVRTVNAFEISRSLRNLEKALEVSSEYNTKMYKVKKYLLENYDELELHADEIAKILDITLEKTIELELSITATVSLSVPVNVTADDISIHDFDLEISCNDYTYDIESAEASVDYINEL